TSTRLPRTRACYPRVWSDKGWVMRTTNRGDVPARHVPPSQAKGVAEDVDDVVFDAGSLSFVQDWVVDGGDTSAAAAAAAEVEPRREDPRKTNPNRRLGVGAQPKKPKQDRPEPSALEKKMLRKRQRQELSDVIAGEMDTHGVVDDDKEGDGESKTASFKKKKKRSKQQGERNRTAPALADPAATVAEDTKSRKKNEVVEAVVGSGDGNSGGSGAGDAGEDGEKPGGKRKARRKKKKSAAPEVAAAEADAAAAAAAAASAAATAATPNKKSATVVEETSPMTAAEVEAGGGGKVAETAEPGESKKQRRGWGKARSKSAGAAVGTAENVNQAKDAGGRSGRTDDYRPRKKTRSRQKNIRKDKRSADERPAYLRAGTPDFSGRGLTEETRKFLGLPQDDFGDAPPAGWGKPGKVRPTASWVIDKKPRRLPKHLEP
ncbi:unnamed protein product, partial [Ectocarpus sp. 12 AP-2014]